jgi:hyperosmotically inducible protein
MWIAIGKRCADLTTRHAGSRIPVWHQQNQPMEENRRASMRNMRMLGIAVLTGASAMMSFGALAQDNAAAPVTSASADNTKVNERDKSPDTVKPTDQPNNSVDIQLAAAVRQAIVNDKALSTTAHNVKLIAANGVVTLRGPVTSQGEKEKVGQCVAGVTGVAKVDNQLDVKTN